ncbi:MAG: PAS domain-containing protein, partial [Candidatus Aegiribacteria sp.]|nr:PAS domain-containing protein [Candidatus Aegiribacteria sp.]MBD3294643.1 PAS domain-containing protein [Candidatus Fermentibacteria bacterium]
MLGEIDTLTLDAIPAIAILHDLKGDILWGNSSFLQTVDRTIDEIQGLKCHEAWGLETPCENCPVRKAIETGGCAEAELSHDTQNGWPEDGGAWLTRAVPVTDDDGTIRGALEIVFEITPWKEIQRLARDEKVFSSTIIEQSAFPMFVADTEGYVVKVNSALQSALNLGAEQIIGKYNVLEDENLRSQGLLAQVRSVFQDLQPARFTMRWSPEKAGEVDFRGGRDVFIDVALFPVLSDSGNLVNVVCQWLDITGRMEALEKKELFARRIANTVPANIYIYDVEEQRNVWYNDHHKRAIEEIGLDPLNISYEEVKGMVHPEDFAKFEETIEKLLFDPSQENVNVQLRMM